MRLMQPCRENLGQMCREFDYWTREHFVTVSLSDGSEYRMAR